MKKLSILVGLSTALASACSQTPPEVPVQLAGPNSLALSGRNLLVATTGNAELRVLDLSGEVPAFRRAPNPLYPLSIPTAPFPRTVAAFTSPDGSEVSPLGFALSPPNGQVAVVDSGELALLRRFLVVDPVAEPSAVALSAEAIPIDDRSTRLVVGVDTGSAGALRFYAVDRTVEGSGSIPVRRPDVVVDLGPGSVPQALVHVRFSDAAGYYSLLAVADRQPDAGVKILDLAAGFAVSTTIDVGGSVLAVAFQPDGSHILGLHDLAACQAADGTATACDCTASTTRPCGLFIANLDGTDVKSVAVEIPEATRSAGIGAGSPRGLAVAQSLSVTLPEATAPTTVSPGVLVSSTNGALLLYGGADLEGLDVNEADQTAADRLDPFLLPVNNFSMPSAIEFDPLGANGGNFYAAFEGGNAVIQIRPSEIRSGTDAGLSRFE